MCVRSAYWSVTENFPANFIVRWISPVMGITIIISGGWWRQDGTATPSHLSIAATNRWCVWIICGVCVIFVHKTKLDGIKANLIRILFKYYWFSVNSILGVYYSNESILGYYDSYAFPMVVRNMRWPHQVRTFAGHPFSVKLSLLSSFHTFQGIWSSHHKIYAAYVKRLLFHEAPS